MILQLVRAKFGHETDAASLLLLVEKDSSAFGGDALEGKLKLEAAVTADDKDTETDEEEVAVLSTSTSNNPCVSFLIIDLRITLYDIN